MSLVIALALCLEAEPSSKQKDASSTGRSLEVVEKGGIHVETPRLTLRKGKWIRAKVPRPYTRGHT